MDATMTEKDEQNFIAEMDRAHKLADLLMKKSQRLSALLKQATHVPTF